MNQQQFESRLAGLREEPLTELPELVQARMNDTYRVIGGMEGTDPKVPETAKTSRSRRKRSWLTRVMISAASVAAGLVLIISLGFVSPAMADTLKQLPFLESVFKVAGDAGLKKANETGVTADIQQSVTHDGLTFSVSEQMYDGSRLSLVLTRKQDGKVGEEGPLSDLWTIPDPETGLLNRIDSYVNGAEVITGGGSLQEARMRLTPLLLQSLIIQRISGFQMSLISKCHLPFRESGSRSSLNFR